jgi:hypothetical protein
MSQTAIPETTTTVPEAVAPYHPPRGLTGLRLARVPPFLELFPVLGVGLIWACAAIGSGELQTWPYLTAKYGVTLVGLALPATLIQFWVNQEIGRYTLLTGEGIWVGFSRIGRGYTLFLALSMILSWIWFGSYVASGSLAVATLTNIPAGWTVQQQTLFWAYLVIAVFVLFLLLSRTMYGVVQIGAVIFLAVALSGMVLMIFQPQVIQVAPVFLRAFFNPLQARLPANFDPADSALLANAVAFAGMGGFFNLMFSYWLKEIGAGMAGYTEPLPGLRGRQPAAQPVAGYRFADTADNQKRYRGWFRAVRLANLLAVGLGVVGILLPTWLSWNLQVTAGGWRMAIAQAEFMRFSWGPTGVAIFFVAAAAYLLDNWLILADSWSRMLADIVHTQFGRAQRWTMSRWYRLFLALAVIATVITVAVTQPATMFTLTAVAQLFGFALFCPALIYLNYVLLPRQLPRWARPRLPTLLMMVVVTLIYWGVAVWYLTTLLPG